MKVLKILKAGKWQDQSYQKQYGIKVGEEIEIGEGTIVVAVDGDAKLGKATCLSHSIADLMAKSGYGEIVTVGDKADAEADNAEPKSEADPAAKDKEKSESGKGGKDQSKGK